MKLPRPNYTKLDPFFCKKGGVYIFQSKAFFLGHVGHFFGPWEGLFVTPGPVSNFEGGFPRMRGDLNQVFLAGHRLKIKDNLYMHALSM